MAKQLTCRTAPNGECIEAGQCMHSVMPGVDLIAAERQRQIEQEGWTPEHDAEHVGAEASPLVLAAISYLRPHRSQIGVPAEWPWEGRFWKPTPDDRVRELVKAGALIAAEIDRLQRVG